jgi:hypothetical protein
VPKIQWLDLPPSLREHLFDHFRIDRSPRKTCSSSRRGAKPSRMLRAGLWFKDFGTFGICGEG